MWSTKLQRRFPRFSEVSKSLLRKTFRNKWIIKFLRRIKGGHIRFLELKNMKVIDKYLLLAGFEGRTVSYGPIIIINRRGKQGSVTYKKGREDKFSKTFIISLLTGSDTTFIYAERLQISEVPRKQNDSI